MFCWRKCSTTTKNELRITVFMTLRSTVSDVLLNKKSLWNLYFHPPADHLTMIHIFRYLREIFRKEMKYHFEYVLIIEKKNFFLKINDTILLSKNLIYVSNLTNRLPPYIWNFVHFSNYSSQPLTALAIVNCLVNSDLQQWVVMQLFRALYVFLCAPYLIRL